MQGDFIYYKDGRSVNDVIQELETGGGGGGGVTVDSALSTTSTNPVQNKVITTELNKKQATLQSGSNIKTVNNQSLLGSGNIEIPGGTVTVDSALSTTSTNPVQNKVINTALNGKQATLQSGKNIKTVNNQSLLGSGNIQIEGGCGATGTDLTCVSPLTGSVRAEKVGSTVIVSPSTQCKAAAAISTGSQSATVFTLPEGYRPSQNLIMPFFSPQGFSGTVNVKTTGVVTLQASTAVQQNWNLVFSLVFKAA